MPGPIFPQLIIARKRDGHALTRAEITAFVQGVAQGEWADYQATALLMAIYLRGMTPEETSNLTEAMIQSGGVADLASVPGVKVDKHSTGGVGDKVSLVLAPLAAACGVPVPMIHSGAVADLSGIPGVKVDKHSTGGVGDKVSLILAPLAAACGVPVPMMSGRGLGHTGGTLDKLESIPGFRVGLSLADYTAQLRRIGVAMIGQTTELAPADRKLYALRDVTATVESIPLICASIMSKKLAAGIDALVLDVKFGRGAFMQEKTRARELAAAMVAIGRAMGKPTRALLTSMDQPLGRAVGNAVEVVEALEALRGHGPADLMDVTFALGVHMLLLGRITGEPADARRRLEAAVTSGAALAKFRELVAAQGGDVRVIDDYSRLPQARIARDIAARESGYVTDVDPMGIAQAALLLGAGRARATAAVDPAVGITHLVHAGEVVAAGGRLATVHARDDASADAALELVGAAFKIGPRPVAHPPLLDELVE
jgi:pyrimidine-nucleoside phosphorylase